jgi:uncharacterized protein (DUF362 family)
MNSTACSRRKFIGAAGATAGAWLARPVMPWARTAVAARVAVGMCRTYDSAELVGALGTLFDQIGGLETLVRGKTVAMKINLIAFPTTRFHYKEPGLTHWTHPAVIGATIHLLAQAGAYRIRVLEGAMGTAEPLEEFMLQAGWEPRDILSAAPRVEMENTNVIGKGKKYSRLWVPGGGLMYEGYDLNHSYEDCDVFVSLAKLKEHRSVGITLSMKNCYGITPCTIYGDGAPEDEPGLVPKGGRGMFHHGNRQPPKSAPQEIDSTHSTDEGYRLPRVIADVVAARPVHLAIIDGIETATASETPGPNSRAVNPGVLVAGTNCVSTDAVCAAIMGFDPVADHGTAPFEHSDSTLRVAEQLGVGSRNLDRIELAGTPIAQARFDFRKAWESPKRIAS